MLRITRLAEEPGLTRLILEGRVTRRELEELDLECRGSTSRSERLVLELSRVLYVDEAGAEALTLLRRQGIELEGCSAFVRELLNEVSS
jgi:hypothetical protein